MTADLNQTLPGDESFFDEKLEEAVRKYQYRHGLKVDGIVGPHTLSKMNIPVEDLIRTIELNLERWRWLPHDLGSPHIMVNIANFRLDIMENNHSVLTMRVVVGSNYRRTPVFSDSMTYLVINPYWLIPESIAEEDILPIVIKNPRHLSEKGIKIFRDWKINTEEIDPAIIDWQHLAPQDFPFILRQEPGPHNLLGSIKFMFPNKFNVYLHDTPQRELFRKMNRDLSSGCIRVEKPIDLAVYLLQNNESWNRQAIEDSIASGRREMVRLSRAIPIHLLYRTAWVDVDGLTHFRSDIYDRDSLLDQVFKEVPVTF